jgi:hypothetical protein
MERVPPWWRMAVAVVVVVAASWRLLDDYL